MAGYTHTCSNCGTEMSVHERYLGRTLRCTGCRTEFVADPTGAPSAGASGPLPETVRHTCTACGTEMTVAARYYGRTLRCTQCGEEFTARLPVVLRESDEPRDQQAPVEPAAAPDVGPEARSRRVRRLGGATVVVAFLAVVLWYLGGNRDEGFGSFLFKAEKARTHTGQLRFGDSPTILVALDRDGVERLLAAARAGGRFDPSELAQSPGFLPVAAGTRVRVLERRRGAEARVRILNGPQNSRVVWVPIAWVR